MVILNTIKGTNGKEEDKARKQIHLPQRSPKKCVIGRKLDLVRQNG